jgi:intein-encoded DNA endonuclease-like protein
MENIKLDKLIVIQKYTELKNFARTASYFSVGKIKLKNFFIANDIPYQKKKRYLCDDDFFSRNTEDSFYWAGFIAADGNVSKDNDICIKLKSEDYLHLQKFKNAIKSDTIISFTQNKQSNILINNKIRTIKAGESARIRIRSKKMAFSLEKFNIVPNKTKIYDIPNWILEHKLFPHFLRGYFDGDGYFIKVQPTNTQHIRWGICGNFSPLEKILKILLNKCKITGRPQFKKHGNIYKLDFQKQEDVLEIINFIYKNATIFLNRKFEVSRLANAKNGRGLHIKKQELIKLYQKVKSAKLVAKELNCSKSTIILNLHKFNIPIISNTLEITYEELFELAKSKSAKEIAVVLNCSISVIYKYLKKYSIK